uniref:Kanadaptin n=1 Tax=Lygus hesperus TaxID=30085 RepID=A0A146LJF3_LYGHE
MEEADSTSGPTSPEENVPNKSNHSSEASKSRDDDDGFKKPAINSHVLSKKNMLYKYMQNRKGFVQGGTLTSVSSSSDSVAVEKTESIKTENVKSTPPQAPPPLKYEEPDWGGVPEKDDYFLEEIKSGVIAKTIPLKSKSFFTFGRLETCDVPMAHPTVSRYHAVLQYRQIPEGEDGPGFYLYDLGSTHGTFVNKYKVKSKVYGRIKVGHMIKVGCSSRFFILQGPEDDVEEESNLTFTELKQKREQELRERKLKEEREKEEEEMEKLRQEKLLEEKGISWGISEDADEETDLSVNPYAVVTNEELYIDDPKKALRLWFEREGEELNYEIEKAEKGMFVCKVVLPVDGEDGCDVTIENSGRNKRDAQVQCALDACRALDKLGVFRPTKRESKKAKKRNWEENDYYDSDEDSFFDRTGDLERKRKKRMEKAGKISESVETYESLKAKYSIVIEDLEKAERAHAKILLKVSRAQKDDSEDVDELDAFMANLKKAVPSKAEIKAAENEVEKLKLEEVRLRQLVNIAKPATLPDLRPPAPSIAPTSIPPSVMERESDSPASSGSNQTEQTNETQPKAVIGPKPPIPETTQFLQPKPVTTDFIKAAKPQKQKKSKPQKVVEDDFEDLVWRPPKGQTGDGRTSLNDKLGY